MDPAVGVVLLVLLLATIVTFMSVRDRRNKVRIANEIRRVGGEPLEIGFKFVGYDRDNQHYQVRFTDAFGRKHETRCKVNIWQNSLFWQRTPAELLGDLPVEESQWHRLRATRSTKEQIIDDLVAENERLRHRLVQAEQSSAELKIAK